MTNEIILEVPIKQYHQLTFLYIPKNPNIQGKELQKQVTLRLKQFENYSALISI